MLKYITLGVLSVVSMETFELQLHRFKHAK